MPAMPVELGAGFIRGRPPELMSLVGDAGIEIVESHEVNACFQEGILSECP
jgi:hypothetical protein